MVGLDYRTAVLGGFIIFFVCTVLVGTLWRQNRDIEGLGFSFLGFSLVSLGMGLMFLRNFIDPFISIIMANGFTILGLTSGLAGAEKFLNLRCSHRKDLAIWVLSMSMMSYFTYIVPSIRWRILCFSASLIYVSWRHIKITVIEADQTRRKLTIWLGLVFMIFLSLGLLRMISAIFLYRDVHSTDLPSGVIEVIFSYTHQVIIILWANSLNLMVNKKLIMDLDRERIKFASIFNRSPHGIILTRLLDGAVIDANPGLSEIIGLQHEEIIDSNVIDIGIWSSQDQRSKMIQKIRQDGAVRDMEIKFKHSSGRQVVGSLSIDQVSVNGQEVLLSTIIDVTDQKKLEQQIAQMAQTDPLTGLLNRAAFSDRLDQAMKKASYRAQKLSLMFLDLDRFKPVNDDFGHAVGDVVLRETTRRMTDAVGDNGTIGRIGGDEFVVLMPFGEDQARATGEKIRSALDSLFEIEKKRIEISCSIGIAVYPDHGTDEIELSKNADQAMYAVKKAGGNGVRVSGQVEICDEANLKGAWG